MQRQEDMEMNPMNLAALVSASLLALANGDGEAGGNVDGKGQLGFYFGPALALEVADAHGDHLNAGGVWVDTAVENIELEQDMALGLNGRYFPTRYLGIDADFMYSQIDFPQQQVILGGVAVDQPRSDLEAFTLSVGPSIRFKGDGIWQALNPYATAAFSIVYGSASDVDQTPVYGEGGSSSLDGMGYNVRLGAQYNAGRARFSLEYRYESLEIEIDHFRSFEQGLELTKSGSYLLFGFSVGF
jgi:hypothetical protein